MNRRTLIAGAGANQVPMIAKARELGLFTVAVDGNSEAPGFVEADVSVPCDITDVAAVTDVAKEHRVDGIYPAAEWAVEAVSGAVTELGLPGITPETAVCLRNKAAQRDRLSAAGLPVPDYVRVASPDDLDKVPAFPVIVKPVDGNASRSVSRADTMDELVIAVEQAIAASRLGTALVESYIVGREYNMDGIVYQSGFRLGGITSKDLSPAPHRFDWGICMPPRGLSTFLVDAIERCVAEALEAIGFDTGTCHAEVILSPDGPRIVEIAGRPGGGGIPSHLIPDTTGMDYMADSLRVSLGEAPEEVRQFDRGAAVHWFRAGPGLVQSIEGLDEVRAWPEVRELDMPLSIGDRVEPIIDCVTRDRMGYVYTVADSAEEAWETAKRVCKTVQIVTNR
jgi:biotin carboxylase